MFRETDQGSLSTNSENLAFRGHLATLTVEA
jgi:hypothetical protein